MLTFIIRRILAGIVLLFVISFVAFLFLYAGSGDIARRILGQNATAETVRAEGGGARAQSARSSCSTGTG